MEKNEFTLQMENVLDVEYYYDGMEEDYSIMLSAWEPGGDYMIDQHILYFFPELQELRMEELMEGTLGYYGDLSVPELTRALISLGFNVMSGGDEVGGGDYSVRLQGELESAINREDYEEAARLRDIINKIR